MTDAQDRANDDAVLIAGATESANRLAKWINESPLPPSDLHDVYDAHAMFCTVVSRVQELEREVARLTENEGLLLRRFSDVVSVGNASTWDEILDAVQRLEREVARLKAPQTNPLLATSHPFKAMPESGMEHLCIACGQPDTYPLHAGPWPASRPWSAKWRG